MLRFRHCHLLHFDFNFPDTLSEFFTALAESRYVGHIRAVDISAGLSVIVSTVVSVEQILDSGRCILFFKFCKPHTTSILSIDELLNLQLQFQINNITMRCPYLLISQWICRGYIPYVTTICAENASAWLLWCAHKVKAALRFGERLQSNNVF